MKTRGWAWDVVMQEAVFNTGEVLLEWSALGYVSICDSEPEFGEDAGTEETPYDYFHASSVTVDDGSLLLSARNTHAVYNIDRGRGGRSRYELPRTPVRMGGAPADAPRCSRICKP